MVLTAKQQAQVSKAPLARRAAMKATYNRQNSTLKKSDNRQVARAKPSVRPKVSIPRSLTWAFDAFDKRHLPVDETTAPYTTTNFVNVLEFAAVPTMDKIIVVCPRLWNSNSTTSPQENSPGVLTDYIAVVYDGTETVGGSIPDIGSLRSNILDRPAITTSTQHFSQRGRLHNLSARVTCLGTNTGLYPPGSVYVGTVPVIETYPGTAGAEGLTVKQAWAEDSISVGYIRPISAASLVDKPVCIHSAVAESVSYKAWRDFSLPPETASVGALPFVTAIEPIVIYVPRAGNGTTAVNYRIEVGQQWCTRHPHNVMLRSTQVQHKATPPGIFNGAVEAVKDIGEHLLNRAGHYAAGAVAGGINAAARQAMSGARPPMLALA